MQEDVLSLFERWHRNELHRWWGALAMRTTVRGRGEEMNTNENESLKATKLPFAK